MNKSILLYALLFNGIFLVKGAISDSDILLGSIRGRVIDNVRKQPVAYAAIVVKLASDQTTITGEITNEDGTFQIEKLPDGSYIVEVQFIGYKTHMQEITLSKNIAAKRKRRDSNTKQSGGGIL